MSVDKLRETHHVNRVAPSDLGLLMSAQSYRPEITQAIRKIKSFSWAPLQSLVKNVISPGPHPVYGGTHPCLKTKNVNELLADLEPADFADVKGIGNLAKVQVERGDLLINLTGAGSIGRVSVYYGDDLPITNQHIARMGIKDAYDEGYVAAFLRTWWGERALEQGVAGSTGQINMVNDHVRSIPVIIFNASIQKYIGDKVRQAERLRAWAARAQEEAVREMPAYKSMISHYEKGNYRVSTDTLHSARLDSSFFHPDHRALDRKMKESGCQYLGKVASAVKPGWNRKSSDCFLYYEIGGLNVLNGTLVPAVTLTSDAPSRATTAVKQGDVLVSTVRPNRKNVGFVIEDSQDIPMVATSGFSVLRFASLVEAAFYHAWLRTDDATSQLMRWNSGSAYPAIDEDVPLHIFVPEFDASLRARLGQTLLDTHFALLHSAKLTDAAKLLVEALIKGQITEPELIAAEQALQAGNDEFDRRVLNQLTVDGVAGKEPALFSDLDELYRLLLQAEGK